MIKNMPGILDESARLHVGVKTGDAGVMNELLQAAYDPSAGQQALQAGEPVQQQCLAFDQQALVSAVTTAISSSISNTMTTAMTVILETNTAAFGATLNSALENNNAVMTALVTKMEDRVDSVDAKLDELMADADAKMADNKADTDAKMADNKADTDAKMAEIMSALTRVGTVSATGCVRARVDVPDAPAKLPMRKYQKYTAESKKITLQWLMKNISYPYADSDELEILQKKTDVDTIERMRQLIHHTRIKEMVQDKHGKWCRRTTTKPSVVGNKHSWTQKSISDCM